MTDAQGTTGNEATMLWDDEKLAGAVEWARYRGISAGTRIMLENMRADYSAALAAQAAEHAAARRRHEVEQGKFAVAMFQMTVKWEDLQAEHAAALARIKQLEDAIDYRDDIIAKRDHALRNLKQERGT